MLVRTLAQLEAEGRTYALGDFKVIRRLNKSEGLHFSVSEAQTNGKGQFDLWYKNHWEVNFVRAGSATIEDRTSGDTWPLAPGTLYGVGPHDKHRLRYTDGAGLRIISLFNPPTTGSERHDADGAFPPTGEDIPKGPGSMFVRTAEDVRAAGREQVIDDGHATVQHYVTQADGVGFSVHSVLLAAGSDLDLWYKHHWEANVVLKGSCDVTDRASGEVHSLGADDFYLVGPKDRHRFQARTDVHILSIFDPPITGTEVHDEEGTFPPTGPVPAGPGSD